MAEQDYAFIKDGVVVNIAIFDDPTQELLDHFVSEFSLDLLLPSDEDVNIGWTYDGSKFTPAQPFPSWTLDEETNSWVSPVPHPNDTGIWWWNEESGSWIEMGEVLRDN
jgi:hypothetical protein